MNFNYNPKFDYLICRTLAKPRPNWNEMRLRKVFYGEADPKTQVEKRILILKEILNHALNHDYQKIHFQMLKTEISNEKLETLRALKNTTADGLMLCALIEEFDDFDFASLVFNVVRIEQSLNPLLFQSDFAHAIAVAAQSKDNGIIQSLLNVLEIHSEKMNRRIGIVAPRTIFERIRNQKDNLMKFGIKELYVYGSYARGNPTEYSDLDILAFGESEVNDYGKTLLIREIEKLIFSKVDLTFTNSADAVGRLYNRIKTYMKRII